ncbi:MAG: substrate-binding domain-containing protein [Actinobacteria bacterium]|nr:substrate-binding domain-containing protein [Actinomycetota bacterium]
MLVVSAAALALAIAACGSSGGSGSSGSASTTGSSESATTKTASSSNGAVVGEVAANGEVTPPPLSGKAPAEASKALEELIPASARSVYDHYWTFSTLLPDAYTNWTPPKAPYKMCMAETYLGNTWRQGLLTKMKEAVAKMEKEGIASGPLVVTNANGNINLHQAQINQLVDGGCNVIWSFPAGPTGICKAVANARQHNVLFLTIQSPVECPDAMNVAFSEPVSGGATTATALANLMGGKGKVLLLTGIPGYTANKVRLEGAEQIFGETEVEIAGEAQGEWTASTAKSAVLQFLATHPEEINGVWDSGAMATAAAQAFEQSGRPMPKIINFSGDCSWLGYWKEHELESFSISQGPGVAGQEAIEITDRMLKGEEPKANLLLYPLPQITQSEFQSKWWKPGMTAESTCFAEPPGDRAVPPSYFDPFFKG